MKDRRSREDYLEAILVLGKDGAGVRRSAIARQLNFTRASVGGAVSLLANDGAVRFDERKRVFLTDSGYEQAIKIYENISLSPGLWKNLGLTPRQPWKGAPKMENCGRKR
jgi:Mn-dependent DtxR family transcriptional regulator